MDELLQCLVEMSTSEGPSLAAEELWAVVMQEHMYGSMWLVVLW